MPQRHYLRAIAAPMSDCGRKEQLKGSAHDSSMANALSIDVGVDTALSSSGRTLKAGEFVSTKMQVEVSGETIRVRELDLVDQDGSHQPVSLEINC